MRLSITTHDNNCSERMVDWFA